LGSRKEGGIEENLLCLEKSQSYHREKQRNNSEPSQLYSVSRGVHIEGDQTGIHSYCENPERGGMWGRDLTQV